jgi:hypothetical protein
MKKNILTKLAMVTSLISGLGMIYARWFDSSSLVVDIWVTLYICTVSYSGIVKEENKDRNNFYKFWSVAIGVLLVGYILVTIL